MQHAFIPFGVFLVALAATGIFVSVNASDFRVDGDGLFYVPMASDPFDFIESPFSFRFLTSFVVYLLPFDARTGFLLVTPVFLAAGASILFLILRMVSDDLLASLGTLGWMVSPAFTIPVDNPFLADPLTYVLMLLALLTLLREKELVAGLSSVLGVITKEMFVFLILPMASMAFVKARRRWRIFTVIGALFLTYVVWTFFNPLIEMTGPRYSFTSPAHLEEVAEWRGQYGSLPKVFASAIILSFGPIWLVAALGWFRGGTTVRVLAVGLLPLLLGMLVTVDPIRTIAYAFPFVLLLAVSSRVPASVLSMEVALLAVMNFLVQPMEPSATKYLLEAAILGAGMVLLIRFSGLRTGSRTDPVATSDLPVGD